MGNRLWVCFCSDEAPDVPPHRLPSEDHLYESPLTRRRTDIRRDFIITSDVLGTGWSGKVYRAEPRNGGDSVAVKHFSQSKLSEERLKFLENEVEVYLRCDHPNICRLQHVFASRDDVWLVMDLCEYDLCSWLQEQSSFQEHDAAKIMVQIVRAVKYLHSHSIVHRDLKLDNVLHGSDGLWKLIDFGFARILRHAGEQLNLSCGTFSYMSPEVLSRRSYSSPCDMWSVGVIGHMLLRGRPPFPATDRAGVLEEIEGGADLAADDAWGAVSPDGRDFVRRLLQRDPEQRADAGEALDHPWLTGALASQALLPSEGGRADVLRQLRSFAYGSRLRRAALIMLAHSFTPQELQDLQQTFFFFDPEGAGAITPGQVAQVLRTHHPEYSPQKIEDICAKLGHASDGEVHYTTFIAALLAPRAHASGEVVRRAFNAFDPTGSGFITADGLRRMSEGSSGGLPREVAEQWIREVDYKGNAAIDYVTFAAALTGVGGMRLPGTGGGRGACSSSPVARIKDHAGHDRILSFDAVVGSRGAQQEARPQSFTPGAHGTTRGDLCSIPYSIDEQYC